MNLVSCPRCGAQFDVSTFSPGTRFVCGACQNLLQVPAAAAPAAPVVAKPVARPTAPVAKPTAPVARPTAPVAKAPAPAAKAPPAARPAAPAAPAPDAEPEKPAAIAKKPAVDRRRAADGGAAQAPPEGRADRIRRQRAEGGEAPKKNPLPLLLAGVALLGLLAGGGWFLFGGKDGKKAPGAGGGAGQTAAAGDPSATGAGATGAGATGGAAKGGAPEAEKPFEQLDAPKRIAFLDAKRKEAAASAEATKTVVEWMRSKSLAEDAQHCLADGHRSFPSDAWINGELGYRDRGEDVKRIASDELVLDAFAETDPDLRLVVDLGDRLKKDRNAAWMAKADSERLDQAIERLKSEAAKANDPVYQRTKQEYKNLAGGGMFSGMDFAFNGDYRPYVIFCEAPNAENMGKAKETVESTGKALAFIYNRFLQFMKEDLKLDAPRVEDLKDTRFKVFIFKSRESFDAWHTRNGFHNPGESVAAYYQPYGDHLVLMYIGEWKANIIMHEATHQLIHFYARYFCQKEDDENDKKEGNPPTPVKYEDRRLSSAFFWFQEGIAEYFGAAGLGRDEASRKIENIHQEHLLFFKYMQGQKKTWPVEDFLFDDQQKIQAASAVRGGGAGMGDELKALMYAQGWTLVHYFLNGENGKWRDKFHEFMRNELTGKSLKPYLLDAFGLPKRADDPKVKAFIQEVETGYVKYLDELMKRPVK